MDADEPAGPGGGGGVETGGWVTDKTPVLAGELVCGVPGGTT